MALALAAVMTISLLGGCAGKTEAPAEERTPGAAIIADKIYSLEE